MTKLTDFNRGSREYVKEQYDKIVEKEFTLMEYHIFASDLRHVKSIIKDIHAKATVLEANI